MQYVILAIMIVATLAVLGKAGAQTTAGQTFGTLRLAAGILVCGLALMLAMTGRLIVAIPFGAVGLALLLNRNPTSILSGPGTGSAAGQSSNVQTPWLSMELDHVSGAMQGEILSGNFSGRTIDSLSLEECIAFHQEIAGDTQSRQLFEAYLDRTHPEWRDEQEHAAAASDVPMSRDLAFDILGLQPSATDEEIRTAHRELMKKNHPDQGGSTYLAIRINAAKDFLLG